MKKIIFTVTNDLSYDQRMQRICTTLAGHGYDVLLIGRERHNSKTLPFRKYRQHRVECIFEKGKLFYIEYNIRLFFYLMSARFNAVCAIDLDTALPCYFAAAFKGKKKIFDAHEYFTEVPELQGRPLTKWIWKKIAAFSVPKFDLAYTVSDSLKEILEQKYNIPFATIRNVPVLEENGSMPKETGQRTILYQGAFNKGRGLELLIHSLRNIDAKLLLAGEGDLSDELRQLVKGEGLDSKVVFAGNVRPEKLRQLTKSADIGVNLLDPLSKSYYYSLANKFFDYIHAGVPSVNMDFLEYRKINEKFKVAVLITKLEEKEITEAINSLLNNDGLYQTLKSNCLEARKELNWEQESQKLIRLYEQLDR